MNSFRFGVDLERDLAPMVSISASVLPLEAEFTPKTSSIGGALQTLCLLPVNYVFNNATAPTGLGKLYSERQIQFWQLVGLTLDLGLHTCITATGMANEAAGSQAARVSRIVEAPTVQAVSAKHAKTSGRLVKDNFFIPDGADDEDAVDWLDIKHDSAMTLFSRRSAYHQATVNLTRLFDIAFTTAGHDVAELDRLPGAAQSMLEQLEILSKQILTKTEQPQLPLTTLYVPISYQCPS